MSLRANLLNWFNLNKRVRKLERLVQQIGKDNIAVMTIPFLPTEEELPEGNFVSGSELEEDFAEMDVDSVEEMEFFEEQKRLSRQRQKDKLV
jgi:hypothetical protein